MLKSGMEKLHILFLIIVFFISMNLVFSQSEKDVFLNISVMKPQYSNNGSNNTNFMIDRDPILLYTKWDDNVNLSHAILSTNETGNWNNITDNTYGSPKTLGNLSVWSNFTWQNTSLNGSKVIAWKIFANDTEDYWNVTSEMIFYMWSWSNVTWTSPDGGNFTTGDIINLTCNVSDTNNSAPIPNYPVYFYNETDSSSSLIGSNLTNSSGYAVYHWDVSDITGETYYPKCNISDNATLRYNASEYYEANTTIRICNVLFTKSTNLAKYIYFGSVNPDTSENPAANNGDYWVTESSSSTCSGLKVWIRATSDMVLGASSFKISNVTVSNTSNVENGFRLSTSFQLLNSTVPVDSNIYMYFWLDVPEDQHSGVYATTVEIKENATCFG